jgi:DNA-binding transcriptional MerR regulator
MTPTSEAIIEIPVPPKLYRIGEIVSHTGLSRQTIHNYTTMGLIRESDRTQGGHRLYDETVFRRLHQIASLKASRTMDEIRRLVFEQVAG